MMNNNSMVLNKNDLNSLYQLLVQESSLYENLNSILENKQKSIIKGEVEKLKEFTAKEQTLVRQAKAFADSRQYLIQKLINNPQEKEKVISLTNFLELTNQNNQDKWSNLKSKLDNAVFKIKKLNFENHELLHTSMAFVKEMVRVFLPKEKELHNTYSKDGKMNGAEKRREVLNCQI